LSRAHQVAFLCFNVALMDNSGSCGKLTPHLSLIDPCRRMPYRHVPRPLTR
jgi:hypothetical protein